MLGGIVIPILVDFLMKLPEFIPVLLHGKFLFGEIAESPGYRLEQVDDRADIKKAVMMNVFLLLGYLNPADFNSSTADFRFQVDTGMVLPRKNCVKVALVRLPTCWVINVPPGLSILINSGG